MIAYLLLIVAVGCCLRFIGYRYKVYRTVGKLPGPPANFLFGNALELMRYDTGELFDKLMEYFYRYGTTMRLDILSKCWMVFSSPTDIERIVSSNEYNRKSDDYNILQEWLGNGILLDHGNSWFTNRRALTGAFHFKILDSYVPVFEEQANVLVRKLLASAGQPVDIFPIAKLYTLDVILETSMGVQCQAQIKDSAYVRAVSDLSHITFWRMYNPLGSSDWMFRWTKHYPVYRKSLQINREFTTSVITKRRAELLTAASDTDKPEKGRLSLLDILLRSDLTGRQFTNQEVYSQVNNFMFAGHDTTSSAITFILYSCAKYPAVQQRNFYRYGTTVRMDLMTKAWIIFSSPSDIERIVSSNEYNRKSDDYDVLQEWLGNGILLDHGNSWFTNRRALTGAFHFKILDSYVPVFEEQANVLVRKLLASAGQPVDIFPIAKLYTLDVILETSMGVQCQAQIKDSAYGHDTTSSAITFILYSCAKYPAVQQRVYEEIISEIPKGMAIDQQCINNLKYLELVIKESLRMFPPVPYYSRSIDKESNFNGIPMLKGSSIVIGLYMMHHNPDYFPQPELFLPERFEQLEPRNPFSYIPFSAGSRNCIGQKFALNELKTVVAKVLRECKVELPDLNFVPKLKLELILKPVNGMYLRFVPRTDE
uniref:Uncharacterized protein n=1 Tax=Anopheles albimanus TaxID=7167 RepID=A0A182F708_ANOAL